MKNKILIGVLTTSLLVTSGGYAMTYEETQDLKETIEEQKVDSKEKSTEIANLETTIENMDIDLKAKNMVIEESNAKINDLTVENKKLTEENNKLKKNKVSKRSDAKSVGEKSIKTMTVNASAYLAFCKEGCTGRTRSGYDVSNTIYYNGMRIIASDLSVLPMYSIVKLEGLSEKFIVLDTGGAIKGKKIDVLFNSQSEAVKFGRRNIKLEVIRYGK